MMVFNLNLVAFRSEFLRHGYLKHRYLTGYLAMYNRVRGWFLGLG